MIFDSATSPRISRDGLENSEDPAGCAGCCADSTAGTGPGDSVALGVGNGGVGRAGRTFETVISDEVD